MTKDELLVKEIGDKIGYGHLMSLASAFWRADLKKSGTPADGAFIPTTIRYVKDKYKKEKRDGQRIYDIIITK